MASSQKEVKVQFSTDTKKFTDGIKQANSTLTQLRSELRLNKTEADSAGASIENYAERQKILSQELEQQKNKISNLNSILEEAKRVFGDGSQEVEKYQTQLNNATIALNKIQSEYDQTTAAMKDFANSTGDGASKLSQLESSIEQQESALSSLKSEYNKIAMEQGEASDAAQKLAREISDASQELKQSKSAFDQANSAADKFDATMDDVADAAEDMADSLDSIDVAIGDFVSDMAQNAIGAIADFEESTRESRTEMAKLETAAKQSGVGMDDLSAAYEAFYAVSGDSDVATTSTLNMVQMGLATEDLYGIVNSATGAWATYGSNLPIDSLVEAANETMKTSTVTGAMADALNWAGLSAEQWAGSMSGIPAAQQAFNKAVSQGMTVEDAFNEALAACSDEQERAKLVTDALGYAYGSAGLDFQEANEEVIAANKAANDLAQAQNELASAIAPVSTAFTELQAGALQWIVDNFPLVTSVVTGLGVALGTLLIVKNISTLVSGLSSAFTFLTSPLGLVVTAIGLLVAGFMYAYQTIEPFRTAVDGLVQQVGEALAPILQSVSDWFANVAPIAIQMFTDFITTYVVPALEQFGTFLVETVFPTLQQFGEFFTTSILPALQQLADWITVNVLPVLQQLADFVITSVVPAIQQFAQWVGDNVVPALGDLWNWIQTNVVPALSDLWNWITANVVPALQDFGNFIVNDVVPALQDMWGWIQDNVVPVLQRLADFVTGTVVPALEDFWGFISDNVIPILQDLWNFITGSVIPTLGDLGGKVIEAAGKFGEFVGEVKEAVSNALNAVTDTGNNIIRFFSGLPGKIVSALGNLGNLLLNAGRSIISGLYNGIRQKVQDVFNFVGGIGSKIASLKGPIPYDLKLLIPNGMAITEGLGTGLENGMKDVYKQVDGYTKEFEHSNIGFNAGFDPVPALSYSMDAKVSGMAGLVGAIEDLADRVISIEIDGKQLARATASSTDRVNGSRQQLVRRGVALA